MKNKKEYEYFVEKARSELILKREEALLVELRATREYLEALIEQGAWMIHERLDHLANNRDEENKNINGEKR